MSAARELLADVETALETAAMLRWETVTIKTTAPIARKLRDLLAAEVALEDLEAKGQT
jgi:hypothetical protein